MPEINHLKAEPMYLDSWFHWTNLGLHGNICFHGNHGSRLYDMDVPVPPNQLKTSRNLLKYTSCELIPQLSSAS